MKLTIGTTYYDNPEDIKKFIENHIEYADEIIIVDDGSKKYPLRDYFQSEGKLQIYEVTEDLGFNSHGCRNLIMTVASNDWVMLLDSDRLLIDPGFAIQKIKETDLDEMIRYQVTVHTLKVGRSLHPSVNDFLIHKKLFFSVGGYDEEWVGTRHGDRFFIKQLEVFGCSRMLPFVDLLYTRRATWTHIATKRKNDVLVNEFVFAQEGERVLQLIEHREITPDPNKPILQFPWRQITDSVVTTNHK